MYIVLPVLLVLVLALAACEKDRPVQTPTAGTAQPSSGEALTTPGPDATREATSAETATGSQSSASQATVSAAGAATPKPAPSQTTVSAPAAQVSGQGTVYTVQLGDTLGAIAKQFGVTTKAIIELNSLTNPDVLMVGQELKIPGPQAASEQGGSGEAAGGVYIVSQGDTLGSIAKRFGVSVAELQELNDIADPDQIFVGQELRIPNSAAESPATPTSSEEKTYVVQQGDTLFKIALRFGITLEALESANNITDTNKVYPGQVLKIP
jgi:LysM repeat protein